jgi:hypothetical protein
MSLLNAVQPKAKEKYSDAHRTALLNNKQKVRHKTFIFFKHLLPDIISGPKLSGATGALKHRTIADPP